MIEIREEWDEHLHGGSGTKKGTSRSSSARGQYRAAGAAATVFPEDAGQASAAAAPAASRAALPADSVESGSEEESEDLDDLELGEPQEEERWERRRFQLGNGVLEQAPAGSGDAEVAGSDVMFGSGEEDEVLDIDLEAREVASGAFALGSGGAAEGAGDDGHAEDDEGDFEALMVRMEVG